MTEIPGNEPTLLFDTEKSAADYIDDYAKLPGHQGPLWHDRKIPVLGVSGDIGMGKTTFLLDIVCGPIKYVDLPAKMLEAFPGGWRPVDMFLYWWRAVQAIPAGRFRVIALDCSEHIEVGLADWVRENPLHFNHTGGMYTKMPAIYQGDVSALCLSIFMMLSSKCETFAFANHTGLVFNKAGEATGEKKNKGRPVFKEMAALYIKLTREKDQAGNIADEPSGTISLSDGGKARMRRRVGDKWAPILPPRLPIATPAAIRQYILTPPNYAALRPEERAPDHQMTEDERIQNRIRMANAEAEAEQLKIQRMREERNAAPSKGDAQSSVGAPMTSEGSQVSAGDGHPQATPGVPTPTPQQAAETPTVTTQQPAAPDQHVDEPNEKQRVRDAITAAVKQINLPADKVQEIIQGHILAVNEGVSASLGRLGVKKLAAILERMTGAPAPVPHGQPATLQETLATGSAPTPPAVAPQNSNGAHTEAAPIASARIRTAWEELTYHLQIPADVKDKAFEPLLARYNVSRVADLNDAQAGEVEGIIVGKLRAHYAAHPELGPPPF